MSINKTLLRTSSRRLALFLALGLPLQPLLAAIPVGQTASEAKVDGLLVPSGTTLLSPAAVATSDKGAVVHLANGTLVALAPGTAATIESAPRGIRLTVEEGGVAYANEVGEVEYLSQSETLLASAQGEVTEGPRKQQNDDRERLCQLRDWSAQHWRTCRFEDPDNDDCTWDLIEVSIAEVPKFLDRTALLACEDRNELALECDCTDVAAVLWWIPVAAVGGGWALSETIGTDKEPASRITP